MTKPTMPTIKRRTLLLGAAAGLAAPAIWRPSGARAQSTRIVVRDDGGIYTQAYTEIFYRPFTEATGIEVVPAQAQAEPTAQIRSMVETGTYTWDMGKISVPAVLQLTTGETKYLEPVGLDAEAVIQSIPAHFRNEYQVGTNVYTTVLAYRRDAFEGREAPASWADLMDPERFPGRRALRRHPYDTLEQALMADGVPADQVYPLDLDRAFVRLDKVQPATDIWWTSGAQAEQLLISGEVDLLSTWVSRAQSAQAAGAPVEIVWNQNIWGCDGWSILKGTPNADACRELIKFASDPARMAQLVKFFPAGIVQPAAFETIPADVAKNCPTYPANIETGLQIDAAYWLENADPVIERFNSWFIG